MLIQFKTDLAVFECCINQTGAYNITGDLDRFLILNKGSKHLEHEPTSVSSVAVPYVPWESVRVVAVRLFGEAYFRETINEGSREWLQDHMPFSSVMVEKVDDVCWTMTELLDYFNAQNTHGFIAGEDKLRDVDLSQDQQVINVYSSH